MQQINGRNILVMENKGGDTAYLDVTGSRQYELAVYIDAGVETARAVPVASVDAFGPGSLIYIYNSSGGYRITGSNADLASPGAFGITACPLRVRLVDESAGLLVMQRDLACNGSRVPATTPVPGQVSANFSAGPVYGAAPLAVQFSDLSTGPVITWNWAFGDGNTSAAQRPTYTYPAAGTYSVTLTVSNGSGTDMRTRPEYITVTAPVSAPVKAAFSNNPSQGDIPLSVRFTDLSTGPVVSWYWTFGDGGSATDQNPSHTYTVVGWKTVNLTVTNASGGSDTYVCTGSCIKATAVAPVKADFSASPTTGNRPLTVQFRNLSTGPVNWWLWDFGDNRTCNERACPRDASHTYNKSGTFSVSLTVRNSTGSDTMTRFGYITVL